MINIKNEKVIIIGGNTKNGQTNEVYITYDMIQFKKLNKAPFKKYNIEILNINNK